VADFEGDDEGLDEEDLEEEDGELEENESEDDGDGDKEAPELVVIELPDDGREVALCWLASGVAFPSGPISRAGRPGGGGMMPGAPATAAGMTIIGRPSAPNQTGKIVGPPGPLVVVAEKELGGPFGPGSVVVLNLPDSTAV
jgi:hypothetical protein